MALRIVEPFVKAHLALWLVSKGAKKIEVSVDGAEPYPETIKGIIVQAGFDHKALKGSRVAWTGRYVAKGTEILVISRPGLDVKTILPGDVVFVAEAKGEPTSSAQKAGRDRNAFCAGLGQVILAAGALQQMPKRIALALPDKGRFVQLAHDASKNPILRDCGLTFLLVDKEGKVTEV